MSSKLGDGYLSSVPVSTRLKNSSAVAFMIVHLELATSITRGNRFFFTTIEIRLIGITQNKREIKESVNPSISFEPEILPLRQRRMRQ